jgi:hypothetical protein
MATPYSDIFDKTTKLLQSYTFANLTITVFESYMESWLNEATSVNFIDCEIDLSDVDDTLKQFNNTVPSREQWILAYSICLSWISLQFADEQKLQNTIGDRDYQTYSPANLLKAIKEAKIDIEDRMRRAIEMYSYRDINFADYV